MYFMKNRKKLAALLLSCTIFMAAGGCTSEAAPSAPESRSDAPANNAGSNTITITDHLGNTVEVPVQIDRIVVGNIYPLPSVLTVFFDSGEKIVGMADVSMKAAQNGLLGELYPELLDADTGFIQGTEINVEEVAKLSPDVVFYGTEAPNIGEQLNNAGIPAVAISASKWDYDAIETLNNWLELLGEMFPENAKADICRKYSTEKFNLVQDRVKDIPDSEREQTFFLFQYSEENITTSGKLFFGQWWADAIGCKNVGEELKTDNSTAVNMEQIYAWDPSLIFITNFNAASPDSLYNNEIGTYDWSAIKAVEDKRVYKMPLGMYRSYTPGIDTPITLLWLAKSAYPERFEDIDVTQETKDYYKEVFGIELSDEQANSIFTPVSAASAF